MTIYVWATYIHSILRWAILLLLLICIVQSLTGWLANKPFTKNNKTTSLLLLICAHITALIGIYQWIVGPWGLKNIQNLGMSVIMKDSVARFWAIEHISMMLVAVILITIGRRSIKMNISDKAKHKRSFWFYSIALLLILVAIPWPFREGIGRAWFPHI